MVRPHNSGIVHASRCPVIPPSGLLPNCSGVHRRHLRNTKSRIRRIVSDAAPIGYCPRILLLGGTGDDCQSVLSILSVRLYSITLGTGRDAAAVDTVLLGERLLEVVGTHLRILHIDCRSTGLGIGISYDLGGSVRILLEEIGNTLYLGPLTGRYLRRTDIVEDLLLQGLDDRSWGRSGPPASAGPLFSG